MNWTPEIEAQFSALYPQKGKMWCAEYFGTTEASIRAKAHRMKLKQDHGGEFSQDWKRRMAQTNTGRKRPAQADVMRRLHTEGKLKLSPETRKIVDRKRSEAFKKNGHPRGFLGGKHDASAKEKMSKAAKRTWENITPKQIRERAMKGIKTSRENGREHRRKNVTWKGGHREIGGKKRYFRSRWEANYARYLEWLKSLGQITEWQHEPKTFWFEKIRRGTLSYLPDFLVTNPDGSEEYHEVKGWMDPKSKTKLKRMAKYFPDVKLVLIQKKQYMEILRKVSAIIPEWEME